MIALAQLILVKKFSALHDDLLRIQMSLSSITSDKFDCNTLQVFACSFYSPGGLTDFIKFWNKKDK